MKEHLDTVPFSSLYTLIFKDTFETMILCLSNWRTTMLIKPRNLRNKDISLVDKCQISKQFVGQWTCFLGSTLEQLQTAKQHQDQAHWLSSDSFFLLYNISAKNDLVLNLFWHVMGCPIIFLGNLVISRH